MITARAACAMFILLAACPGDFNVEGQTFPCRAAEDCVEGYECHPSRFVCVRPGGDGGGTSSDSGVRDSGFGDAGRALRMLGASCGAAEPCDEGTCSDGVCCERACDGTCERCDATPGRCLPVAEGTDPDTECVNRDFECSDYTYGLVASSCYANAAGMAFGGTCNGAGACRPLACRDRGMGLEIARCTNLGCLNADACPYGARVLDYDEPSELCASGTGATCTFENGGEGCCSLLGACCPLPMCTPGAACE